MQYMTIEFYLIPAHIHKMVTDWLNESTPHQTTDLNSILSHTQVLLSPLNKAQPLNDLQPKVSSVVRQREWQQLYNRVSPRLCNVHITRSGTQHKRSVNMQLLKQSKHETGFKEASLRVTVRKPDTLWDNAVQLQVRGNNALVSQLSLTVSSYLA